MSRLLYLLLVIWFAEIGYAQQYSEHYYKRKAIFELAPDTENEIIFLGNSITEGGDWKKLFKGKNVINRGISGDVTQGIRDRLDEVVSSKPLQIFLLIGINDLARGKSVAYITKNIENIVKKIQVASPQTVVFLQSVLPVNPHVGNRFSSHKNKQGEILEINKTLLRIADNYRAVFIDLHEGLRDSEGSLKSKYTYDGLHLSRKGYKKWKRQIRQYLK